MFAMVKELNPICSATFVIYSQLFAVKSFKQTSNMAEALRLAEKEITLLKTLAHPNIVGFHGMGLDQNERFIILEYCAGGDLRSMINEAASQR
jgi:serine/threonine protein kinase